MSVPNVTWSLPIIVDGIFCTALWKLLNISVWTKCFGLTNITIPSSWWSITKQLLFNLFNDIHVSYLCTYLALVAIFVTIVRLICIHLEQATVNIQSSSLNSGKVSRFDLWWGTVGGRNRGPAGRNDRNDSTWTTSASQMRPFIKFSKRTGYGTNHQNNLYLGGWRRHHSSRRQIISSSLWSSPQK